MSAPVGSSEVLVDPLTEYIQQNQIKVKDAEQLREELYRHVNDTIDNRIHTQAGRVPNEMLYQYADNLFLGSDNNNKRNPSQQIQSEKCVLSVRIYRAEGLAPKDVTGTSDPYCCLGLAPDDTFTNFRLKKHATKYVTSVKMKTLDPEWNECIEIPVHRDQIESSYLHIQLWDYDEAGTMSSAIGALKDVKGVRAVGRYMKEVAQTMSKKDNDDFMGFSAIPLKNIPLQGIGKWYGMRPHGPLQNISGRLKIGLKLTCPHVLTEDKGHPGKTSQIINGRRIENRFSNDVIYGGILLLIVNGRHYIYKELMAEDEGNHLDGWNGQLQNCDEVLLQEFVAQRRLDKMTCAVARWEVYAFEHIKMPDGIQMQCMTSLLKELEKRNNNKSEEEKGNFIPLLPLAGSGEKASKFTFEKLPSSFDKFLRHCHSKIVIHKKMYPVKANDTLLRLGDLLICMKTLREMKLYLTARLIDTTMYGSGDISKDISNSLRLSMAEFYNSLCVEFKVIGANIANLDEGNPIEEYNVPGLVKLVDALHTSMRHGQGYYHPVFKKVLNIDYMAVVLGVISTRIAEDLKKILDKVNKAISSVEDPIEEDSSDKSASMFQLYLSLRDFTDYIKKLCGGEITNDENSNLRLDDMTDGKEEVSVNVNTLKGYHNWFRPTILRWLQMSRGRIVQRLTAAVELDKVERMDDIVKHSSSAVDAVACLNSVITFWLQIKWPDPMDGFLIATRITEDISSGVELYADLIHDKLKAVGFFDDEGQFDVTEELCLALNNLERVKLFLNEVLRDMEIEALAAQIDAMDEGPTGVKLMDSFHSLVRNAESGMRMKIQEVTLVVGKKMQPDMLKYLDIFANNILKIKPASDNINPLNGHDSDFALNKKEWDSLAEQAVEALMKYLTTNIITLKEWLCDSNFQLLLDILWKVCLQSLRDVALDKYKVQKPYFFRQCRHILEDNLTSFFHAEEEGLPLEQMFAVEEYVPLQAELKMRSASTKDLMRLFFSQMYDEQVAQEETRYGSLNVHAWYDHETSHVKVDVINAENLIPQDLNGLSDPFVQISLRPKVMFPTQRQFQTLEKKKTLNPFYDNESFTFDVDRELMQQEGAMLVFTVLDYDMIGSNDLEGECLLPLNILDGVDNRSNQRGNRNYKLTLTQPMPSSPTTSKNSSPVKESSESPKNLPDKQGQQATAFILLKERVHFDRDASEFCRWRAKLESAMVQDDGNMKRNFIKSFTS